MKSSEGHCGQQLGAPSNDTHLHLSPFPTASHNKALAALLTVKRGLNRGQNSRQVTSHYTSVQRKKSHEHPNSPLSSTSSMMNPEKDFTPLMPGIVWALSDRLYEKRKVTVLEIEK
ncbi:UNVERIFIED_CONTAM: hypothetical protein K2H54_058195 [Gekko kuhli]